MLDGNPECPIFGLTNGTLAGMLDRVRSVPIRNVEPVGGAQALRSRVERLRAEAEAAGREADELDRKLKAITTATIDCTATVADRIRAFLGQHFMMSFSAAEIAEAIQATTETTRKTLQRLTERGTIEHEDYGAYRLNAADRAQRSRGWVG